MPQSPYTIDGVSSVDLGGLYRKVQITLTLTSGTSTPEWTAYVGTGNSSNSQAEVLFSVGNPGIGTTYRSSVHEGFYRYISFSPGAISSAYWDAFRTTLYFDGAQWP